MSNSNYEKNTKDEMKQVDIMISICCAAIIAPMIVWFKELYLGDINAWFYRIDIIFCCLFIYFSRKSIKQVKQDETETITARTLTIAFAAASFLWQCGWAAYLNELVK